MGSETKSIRNVAVVGHGGTGKTTLVEHLLAAAGAIAKPENVESGKTVSDFTDEEMARNISVHTALTHVSRKNSEINLLDTPGSADFIGEVAAALRVTDAALVLVGADTGVQTETIKIWRRLVKTGMPTIAFVNKMDKERADFNAAVEDLREKFEANFVPMMIPMGAANSYKGVVNLMDQKAYTAQQGGSTSVGDIPGDFQEAAEEARMALIEAAAEGNDTLMEKYLEEEDLTEEEALEGLRLALANRSFVPVLCGAALQSSGMQPLLDFIAAVAPNPEKEELAQGEDGADISLPVSPESAPSCFVFKTAIDQFSGKISYVKVMRGTLKSDSELYNAKNGQREKISKIYKCQGKKLEDTSDLAVGDIGALTKLDTVATGDSLCPQNETVKFAPIAFPQPVHAVAMSASSKKDEDKLNQMLQREAQEDPTFQLDYNTETKETVVSSMGELHLSIVLDKIKKNQKIEMEMRVPKVAYRETLTKSSAAEYLHKKQTGGHGQYAKVVLEIKPLPRGERFSFVNAIFGGAISKGYILGVEKGILEGMEAGALAGYPIVDIEAKVVDGKEHSVDSSEMAFKLAARGALRSAIAKAGPVLLEPVMNLEVYVDDQHLGDVLSDLSSRRGRVLGQEPIGGRILLIKAQVPQAELLRYSIDLKSITSGTASFEMAFDHYDSISGRIAENVIKAAKTAVQQE